MEETVLHRALVSSCPWGIDLSPGHLTSAAPFRLVLISLATIMESDSAEELVNILNSCRVPESLSAFVTRAYETTSDFAFAFPKLENMDSLLRDLDEDTLRSMGVEPPASVLTSLPASRLRKALKLCHDLSMQPQHAPASQVTPTPVRSLIVRCTLTSGPKTSHRSSRPRRWIALFRPLNRTTLGSCSTRTPCLLFACSALFTRVSRQG